MAERAGRLDSARVFDSWHIPEPSLIFGDGRRHIDPKAGLALYGPLLTHDQRVPSPLSIKVGIVGTGETVGAARRFLRRLASGVRMPVKNPFQDQTFPGFKSAFKCEMVVLDAMIETIPRNEVARILERTVFEDKVGHAVNLFAERIKSLSEVMHRPDVVLCALPQEVVDYCVAKRTGGGQREAKIKRSEAKYAEKLRSLRESGQMFLGGFDTEVERILRQDVETSNFRRALKARSMKYGMPTQIVWPETIAPADERDPRGQSPNSLAWNVSVGLYYKGSGFPWTMTRMSPGTCYVGVSFYRTKKDGTMRTSMAQVFTYTGEGLILRGDEFEWNEKGSSPHLDESQAEALMGAAVSKYRSHMQEAPSRVVVHKSSRYRDEEKRGFERALRGIRCRDLVAFGKRDIRFFRCGQYPPLRGTAVRIGKKSFILYTKGYTPYLHTYPGGHVPAPLDILEMHGDSDPETVLAEILALSKMNWNSADFSLEQPITLFFSRRVGEVMAYVDDDDLRHEYKFYM